MSPMRPMSEGWAPTPSLLNHLRHRYGHAVDVGLSLEKFKAHHLAAGTTSREWDQRFKAWVVSDVQQYRPVGATDDLGIPLGQRPSPITPLAPGDPGYVDPDDLATEARRLSTDKGEKS